MTESICKLADDAKIQDEQWRRHAAGCMECRELLTTAEWMTAFAAGASPRRGLPAAGYLLFKARLRERFSAADRASRPVNIMAIATGILLVAVTAIGVTLGRETRFGSIMIEAFWLLSSYAWMILVAAVIVAAVCGIAMYFGDLINREGSKS